MMNSNIPLRSCLLDEDDYKPNAKTVRTKLVKKYGDDIIISANARFIVLGSPTLLRACICRLAGRI